jgi:AAA+ superfamily predicted ATPase
MEHNNWFQKINSIIEQASNRDYCELSSLPEYQHFREFCGIPEEEAFLLFIICSSRNRHRGIRVETVLQEAGQYFTKNRLMFALDKLITNGWINCQSKEMFDATERIYINSSLEKALSASNASLLPIFTTLLPEDSIKVLALRAASFRRSIISIDEWKTHCDQYITSNKLKPQIIDFQLIDEYVEGVYVLLFIAAMEIYEHVPVLLDTVYRLFCNDQISRFFWMQKYLSSESPLIEHDLVEVEKTHGVEHSIRANPHCIGILSGQVIKSNSLSKSLRRISFDKIKPMDLYFPDVVKHQTEEIEWLLVDEHFKKYQNQLNDQNSQPGLSVFIFGNPGTGKTEFVYQLAKTTQRDVLFYEVAASRSKWYGETERNIKKVFDEYRRFCKTAIRTPILLFNEADSIFSTRSSSPTAVGQVENTVQTILLNELECFDGILFATSNRPKSFDMAFSRRFHIHVHMLEPCENIRSLLLHDTFKNLSEVHCTRIAKLYSFNGADVKNILRLSIIKELKSKTFNLPVFIEQEIQKNTEIQGRKRNPIGFTF